MTHWRARGETDATGTVTLEAVTGPLTVSASAAGLRSGAGKVDDGAERVRIDLDPAALLVGTVVEKGTGRPIAGVRVTDDWRPLTVTDAEGRFEIEFGEHTPWLVFLRAGFTTERLDLRYLRGLPAGDREVRRIELSRGSRVRGRVVDAGGRAVEGAWVGAGDRSVLFARARAQGAFLPSDAVRTDAEGRFDLDGLPADCMFALYAVKPGLAQGESPRRFHGAGSTYEGETIRLEHALTVVLEVRTRDGVPPHSFCRAVLSAGAPGFRGPGQVVFGRDGEIRLWGLPRGDYPILVGSAGHATRELRSADVLPPEGETERRVRVVLEPAPTGSADAGPRASQGASLSGRVSTPDGAEPAGRIVARSVDGGREVEAKFRGDYRLELKPGRWRITLVPVRWGSPPPAEVEVVEGENEGPVFHLRPASCVTGIVRGPDGPVSGATVLVTASDGEPLRVVRAGPNGRYLITGLGIGGWTVYAGAPRHAPGRWEITVGGAGETVALDPVLRAGAFVRVTALDPDGRPLKANIRFRNEGGASGISPRLRSALAGRSSGDSPESRADGGPVLLGPFPAGRAFLSLTCFLPPSGAQDRAKVVRHLEPVELTVGKTPTLTVRFTRGEYLRARSGR